MHGDEFASADEAQDAALAFAQHHINIQHNDTLLYRSILSWDEYCACSRTAFSAREMVHGCV